MINKHQAHYLDFVTDLRRAVYCLINQDNKNAITFLNHANRNYRLSLRKKRIKIDRALFFKFDNFWNEIYQVKIPTDKISKIKYADKLLTLSSLIYSRITP